MWVVSEARRMEGPIGCGRNAVLVGEPRDDEPGPNPVVALPARVARRPHPERHTAEGSGRIGRAAQSREQVLVGGLGKLGEFVEADVLELGALIPVLVV